LTFEVLEIGYQRRHNDQVEQKPLQELQRIESLAAKCRGTRFRVETLDWIAHHDLRFPIHGFVAGPEDRAKPAFALIGGVHGLENVGTHIILAYLESIFEQLEWDLNLQELFEHVRLVSVPLVNPVGMYLRRRSNGNNVDLNRNSPVDADQPHWLAGGHRISGSLPWYRGKKGAEMEKEAQVLLGFLERELFPAEFALAMDCHSGFGIEDQLWYPFARTKKPFPKLGQMMALRQLWERSSPYHFYRIEPQSRNYTTHGDLFDYLYDRHQQTRGTQTHFLPLTLEMGSWQWVRKNPRQIFSALGPYNPIKPHRYRRIMRRHLPLMNFLLRAAYNYKNWVPRS
jgi:hypothetical protein